ncbi:ubiquinol-cytochrome c reductase iron-sulfur subunit [Bosea sp. (in: a-proteobacteria)]|jgi:ubiquinol-cytochrome c reductase iron-sulfur subunit|uniref:ubiquinol-cytochrome c reductase iron-sulfur subunit n=1 Tax=Bosea sp. (in: a-proteobacteria) TaxID=1871050 RepID=UPI000ACC92B3
MFGDPMMGELSTAPDTTPTRRDFLYLTTGFTGAVGAGFSLWPLVASFQPSADTVALASAEFDLAPIEPGQRITVQWRGQPVFIVRRTPEQIARDQNDDAAALLDPEPVARRLQRPDWLIVVGVCTHLGCIPLGQKTGDPRGEYGGWFCPCHGSVYDALGRVRRRPAPKNLIVPPYTFLTPDRVRIG